MILCAALETTEETTSSNPSNEEVQTGTMKKAVGESRIPHFRLLLIAALLLPLLFLLFCCLYACSNAHFEQPALQNEEEVEHDSEGEEEEEPEQNSDSSETHETDEAE